MARNPYDEFSNWDFDPEPLYRNIIGGTQSAATPGQPGSYEVTNRGVPGSAAATPGYEMGSRMPGNGIFEAFQDNLARGVNRDRALGHMQTQYGAQEAGLPLPLYEEAQAKNPQALIEYLAGIQQSQAKVEAARTQGSEAAEKQAPKTADRKFEAEQADQAIWNELYADGTVTDADFETNGKPLTSAMQKFARRKLRLDKQAAQPGPPAQSPPPSDKKQAKPVIGSSGYPSGSLEDFLYQIGLSGTGGGEGLDIPGRAAPNPEQQGKAAGQKTRPKITGIERVG